MNSTTFKKIITGSALSVAALAGTTVGATYAQSAIDTAVDTTKSTSATESKEFRHRGDKPELSDEARTKLEEAVQNNDYESFAEIVQENAPEDADEERVAERSSEEHFNEMVERYQETGELTPERGMHGPGKGMSIMGMLDEETHETLHEAVNNNDFETFKSTLRTEVTEQLNDDEQLQTIFDQMVERHGEGTDQDDQ